MAKTPAPKPQDVAEQTAPQEPAEVETTLVDFCAEKSRSMTRPELIGAFYASELRDGTVKGVASELEARFDAFCNRPA